MANYILSILIISKNRYEYLEGCINSLRMFPKEEVEIVISDNSDNPEQFQHLLKGKFSDMPNLVYSHTFDALSMTKNSERAVELSNGEYCCFIGDDDSVSLGMIEVVRELKQLSLPGCVCDVASYYWPDCVFAGKKRPPLSYYKKEPRVKLIHSKNVISDVLSYGIQDIKYLVRTYHAVVSRAVLNQVKQKCGCYYPALSPDMANAVACTLLVDKYPYINQPLIISGYSYKSSSGMGLRNAHTGSLKGPSWLDPDVEEKWTPEIPKLWLGYTVWAEAGVKALQASGREDLIKMVNYNAMFAKTWLRYPDQRKMVLSFLPTLRDKIALAFECVRFMTKWCYNTLKKSHLQKKEVHHNISLEEAVEIVNKEISNTMSSTKTGLHKIV